MQPPCVRHRTHSTPAAAVCAAKEAGIAGGSHARNHARNDRRGERVYGAQAHIRGPTEQYLLDIIMLRMHTCTPTTQALEAPDAGNIQNLKT